MVTNQPLAGIEFLCPDLTRRDFGEHKENLHYISERAQRLGATIINDETGDPRLHRKYLARPNTFTLLGSIPVIEARAVQLSSEELATPPTAKPYRRCATSELVLPFVVSSENPAFGDECAYLISEPRQLGALNQLAVRRGQDFRDQLMVREWVPTADKHATSYSVITGPLGDVLAAGFCYVTHPGVKTRDTPDAPTLAALGDPTSPYFTAAKRIHPYALQESNCIPLMGNNNRRLTRLEKRILRTQGIDPNKRGLPDDVHYQAVAFAKIVGKATGLTATSRYMQHLHTGQIYCPSASPLADAVTWNECWHGGADIASEAARRQALDSSLDAIAAAGVLEITEEPETRYYHFLTDETVTDISISFRSREEQR